MRYVVALFVAFLAFTGVTITASAAATVADSAAADPGLLDLLKPVLEAARAGQGVLAACLLLVFAVAAARRYGSKRFPFLASDVGGSLLTLLGSFGGALAMALMAGTAPSLGLATTALGVAFAAAGGYSMAKRLLVPALRAIRPRLGKFGFMVDALLWVFGPAPAIAVAEAAGAAAVAAKPATGAAGIVGEPKDFP